MAAQDEPIAAGIGVCSFAMAACARIYFVTRGCAASGATGGDIPGLPTILARNSSAMR